VCWSVSAKNLATATLNVPQKFAAIVNTPAKISADGRAGRQSPVSLQCSIQQLSKESREYWVQYQQGKMFSKTFLDITTSLNDPRTIRHIDPARHN